MKLTVELIERLVTPVLDGEQAKLCSIKVSGRTSNPLIQLFIDYEDRNVSIDDCVDITRLVQDALDINFESLPNYRLEVSSPGIDFPLTQMWQFRKHCGETIRFRFPTSPETETSDTEIVGRIIEVDSGGIIKVEASGEIISLALEQVSGAKVVLEMFLKGNQRNRKRKRNEARGR